MAVRRQCKCCGKEYDYCPNCAKNDQPQWMVSFCSESCKGLFYVVAAYNMKRAGKAAVQKYVKVNHIAGKYNAPIEKVLSEAIGTRNALNGNQRFDESNTDSAQKADTVIPMRKMESQSWPRFRRRGRR